MSKEAINKWFSVKEKIPKKNGIYLTQIKNKVSKSICFTLFVDGEFMSSFVTDWAIVNYPDDDLSNTNIDSLDDEDSEIYKIGAEIAEMSDEDFSNNLNKILCNN